MSFELFSIAIKVICPILGALKVICEIDGSFEKKQSSLKSENFRKTEAEEGNPFHGLKGNLVRLLGNLAYCSPTNQTLIADLDGFHLILNHFHVDHVNPCILPVNLQEVTS